MTRDASKERFPIGRRSFLKTAGAGSVAALLASCDEETREAFFKQHFLELDDRAKAERLRRLEERYRAAYGREFTVGAEPALDNTVFGYALDLSRCIGCRRCVDSCVEENNLSRAPQVHYIQVLEMHQERGVDLSEAELYYDLDKVPREGHFYMPVACQQCERPPCTRVCPVSATWQEPDGIVVVDYDWCIGCRYCMAACPYDARKFNWAEPGLKSKDLNTETHYLGNRPRYKGMVEKCTFCIQRARKGLYPACVEICPVGARKFGNLLDPSSEVRYVLKNKRIFVLKEELNTRPKFFYFYGM
jgi:molybdopterin-containing oxidoreductase family iron-sulfur binding subunit